MDYIKYLWRDISAAYRTFRFVRKQRQPGGCLYGEPEF